MEDVFQPTDLGLNSLITMVQGGSLLDFVLFIATVVGMWKVFEKANRPGWQAIIPVYNLIVLCAIARKSMWWILAPIVLAVILIMAIAFELDLGVLYFVIFLAIFIAMFVGMLVVTIAVGKAFGKSWGWSVIFLSAFSFIGYPILGFGDAQYEYGKDSKLDMPPAPLADRKATQDQQATKLSDAQGSKLDTPPAPISKDNEK